ncbi:MAG TPA: DUF2911 domain-containing protein [Pirellulales bacterium]|jgi:hypothetical protein|nr:DUF2911 domain-containing protein [Pirellulales bacterium]
MSQPKLISLIAAIALLSPLSAFAQRARTSPHDTISTVIDGDRVTLVYGRPYSKDPRSGEVRKIWGKLVPYGKAWRLGADEATLLVTQKPLEIGDTSVPAGAYTLYMVPDENGAKLAISQSLGGWGIPVDEKHDLARVDLKKEPLDKPNDQLAMALEKNPSGGGAIKIMWDDTEYSVPFTVKK